MRIGYLLGEIERNARRYLADDEAPLDVARELATDALELIRELASAVDEAKHPYRAVAGPDGTAVVLSTVVGLERALADTQARLASAERELAALRAAPQTRRR